jgi:hypothetical protein
VTPAAAWEVKEVKGATEARRATAVREDRGELESVA